MKIKDPKKTKDTNKKKYLEHQYKNLKELKALKYVSYRVLGFSVFLFLLTSLVALITYGLPDNWDIFSTRVTKGYEMNVPFSILIEIAAVAGGVLIGLKADDYMDARHKKDESFKTLEYIKSFLVRMCDIANYKETSTDSINFSICVLPEYKYHWEALLSGSHLAFKTINEENIEGYENGKLYFELNYIFTFWEQNKNSWNNINDIEKITVAGFKQNLIINTHIREQATVWKTRLNNLNKALDLWDKSSSDSLSKV